MDKWLIKKPENQDLEAEKKTDIATEISEKRRKLDDDDEKASTSAKRKTRKYDPNYLQFGFMENEEYALPRPQCVLRLKVLANESMRPNKLLRHLQSRHPESKDKPIDFFVAKKRSLKASFVTAFNKRNCVGNVWSEIRTGY